MSWDTHTTGSHHGYEQIRVILVHSLWQLSCCLWPRTSDCYHLDSFWRRVIMISSDLWLIMVVIGLWISDSYILMSATSLVLNPPVFWTFETSSLIFTSHWLFWPEPIYWDINFVLKCLPARAMFGVLAWCFSKDSKKSKHLHTCMLGLQTPCSQNLPSRSKSPFSLLRPDFYAVRIKL